jgi:hypothetical protein
VTVDGAAKLGPLAAVRHPLSPSPRPLPVEDEIEIDPDVGVIDSGSGCPGQHDQRPGVVICRVAVLTPGPVEQSVLIEAVSPGDRSNMIEDGANLSIRRSDRIHWRHT